jgi:hypothetical protein
MVTPKGVYLVTQYFVNGWAKGFIDDIAVNVRDGKVSWEVKDGRLFVDGKDICRVPNGWDGPNIYNRENTYNEAIKSFK